MIGFVLGFFACGFLIYKFPAVFNKVTDALMLARKDVGKGRNR